MSPETFPAAFSSGLVLPGEGGDRLVPCCRIALPAAVPPVLAVGAFLKNTVTWAEGTSAWLFGNGECLDSPHSIRLFEATVSRILAVSGKTPCCIAHDLHPDFPSTRLAVGLAGRLGVPALAVQHHAAHIAAVAVEHGVRTVLPGLALDGFGLGPGNQSWGGELMVLQPQGDWQRAGHLALLAQPGGDVAAREPWRMGAAVCHQLGEGNDIARRFAAFPAARQLALVLDRRLNSPLTSSCGRLFDAVCGLLEVVPLARFEGEAPMALEKMVTTTDIMEDGWQIQADGVLSLWPLLTRLAGWQAGGGTAEAAAGLFHGTLAAALADWAGQEARRQGATQVALGGGCFFNAVLRRELGRHLRDAGLEPLEPRQLSAGDAGLSVGQAWIAGLSAVPA